MSHRLPVTITNIVAIIALSSSAYAAPVIVASSAIEDNGEWDVGNAPIPFYNTTAGSVAGLTATAGSDILHVNNLYPFDGSDEQTYSVQFSHMLAVGTYQATIDIGDFYNAPFAEFGPIGMTAGGNLLTPTSSLMPTPTPVPWFGEGTFVQWVFNYSIAAGDPNIGSAIGFSITIPKTDENRNAAADNLAITFEAAGTSPPPAGVPAPGPLALLAVGCLALLRRQGRPGAHAR